MASSSTYSNPPCAACKFLRRKCLPGCVFGPYFPPEEPTKFANVHKIFGASNVSKLLNEILPQHREDAVNSLAYEAEARLKDPVYGCVGVISILQRQVIQLQKELDATNENLMRYTRSSSENYSYDNGNNNLILRGNPDRRVIYGPGVSLGLDSGFCYSYYYGPNCSWSVNSDGGGEGENPGWRGGE